MGLAMGSPQVSSLPLWRLGWQRLRQRPLQYVLCVVGIALGVAMMVSIDLANGSAQRAFGLSTEAITGRATHRVVAVSPVGVDEAVYTKIKRQVGQVKAAPVVEGYVKVAELGNQPMRLVGLDVFAEAPFRSYFADANGGSSAGANGTSGAAEPTGNGFLSFLTEPDTVVLPEGVAIEYGVKLGDRLSVDFAGQVKSVRVVGIVDPGDKLTERGLSNFVFADVATAQELLEQVGRLSEIDLIVVDSADLAAVEAVLPEGLVVETAAAKQNAVQQMTAAFELNLAALSLLALVVGMFLIYNTVTFSVIQRRSMFGVLRCLGVTQGQIFVLILAEAGIFSIVGSVLGIALGVVLGRSIVGLITQTINDFYFVVNVRQISLSNFTLVKGLVVGIGSALLASAVPAWEAMRTAPSMILQRSSLENKVLALLPKLVLVWVGLTGAGVLLLRWSDGGLIAAFTGLFAVLLGAALLVPPLTAGVMRVLGPVSGQALGVLGKLAPRDILRSLSRTSVAIAALMVSVSVIIGVSVMVGSFRGTVVSWLDQTLQADIYVSPPTTTANRVLGKMDESIVAELRTFPGVAKAVTYNDAEVMVVDYHKSVKLISADGDVSRGQRPYRWIRPDLKPDPWDALDRGEGVIISEALYLRDGTDEPETVTLATPMGERVFPVIAVFYDYSSDRGTVILDDDIYQALWGDDRIASLGLFAEKRADVDELVGRIKRTFGDRQSLSVQSNVSLRQDSLEIFDRTFAITDALRLLAVVVAFIGVLSTLMSLQLEKQREIGILRSTGMTPGQLTRLTLLETGLMGLMAGVLAMPLGYGLAWILIYVINVRSFGWTLNMVLKGQYFWQALVVAVVAALLAGVYPAWRLGRMNVGEAVRGE
jgi:putative ABC transport system permease protein